MGEASSDEPAVKRFWSIPETVDEPGWAAKRCIQFHFGLAIRRMIPAGVRM